MFERENGSQPRLIWVICITLLSWMILVPLVNSIQIPIGENETGVISLAYLENISPYTDYLKYLILLLLPGLIAVIVLQIPSIIIDQILNLILSVLHNRRVWVIATSLLLVAWLINVPFNQYKIQATLIDSFHEGEFLGFFPNFQQLKQPFVNTVLIHGWGMDVLPTWLATRFIFHENGIALTRLFVNLENVVTCLAYFWIFGELTQAAKLGKNRLPIFLISCLLYCILDGIFFKFDGRRGTFFMLQFALTLRFFRVVPFQINQARILAIILGLSLPASFLYVYDRAIYFLAVYLCACGLTLFLNQKITKTWIGGTLLGSGISSSLIIAVLGIEQVSAIASQILYWGKYGRYISFIPLPPLEMTLISQNFWLSMLIQSAVFVYLLLDLIGNQLKIRPFLQKNYIIILLLSASFVYMRITLDRSDLGHAYHGAIPTVFIVAYLIYIGFKKLKFKFTPLNLNPSLQIFLAILILGLVHSEPGFSLQKSLNLITRFPVRLSTPDYQIIQPDYLEALTVMQPEIQQQFCFYTLTSEGLWYYLFNQPSCSKYSYVLYAKPTVAQQEVIEELEQTQPDILLLSNAMWYQNPWDRVLKTDSASLIYQNVLQNYRPYKQVQSHWFWKRSNRPLTLTQTEKLNGNVEVVPEQPILTGDEVFLSGWAVLPEKQKPADAVYLSYGDQNQLIAVAKVNVNRPDVAQVLSVSDYQKSGWSIQVPTAILPLGNTRFKVWAYDGESENLIQLPTEIKIQVRI